MNRVVAIVAAVLTFADVAAAQPNLPGIFLFAVDLSPRPELLEAKAVDVRVRLLDAQRAELVLHEEVIAAVEPNGKSTIKVRLGFHRPLAREQIEGRSVIYEAAARVAGQGEFAVLSRSAPTQLVFEKPKTLWEKIRLDRWVLLGVAGQILFTMRFLIQWIATERRRESTVPIAFWWCSLVGGAIVLVYGLVEREPIIILGQCFAFVVYLRNLFFIYSNKGRSGSAAAPMPEDQPYE